MTIAAGSDRTSASAPASPSWAAFESLLRRHHRELRSFAYRLLQGVAVDDVLQNAYLRAYRAWPRFDRRAGSDIAWLYRIVYHCSIDELRRRQRTRTDPLDDELQPLATADEGEQTVRRLAVAAALAALAPELRATVLLVDVHGLDYAAAGEALGLRRGTVASRLSTARAALRAHLKHVLEEE